jgi:cell wall-associated NlpC family hydrolase
MTQSEFIARAGWLPWVRWRSDWAACDCYGLIVLYHREVLGVDPGDVPQSDMAEGFDSITGWVECEQHDGASCFMSWRNGAPTHCGILLGDEVLHSEGAVNHPGGVRVTKLATMRRVYGLIKFYKYSPC